MVDRDPELPVEFDPQDFEGTTLEVKPKRNGHPGRPFLAVVTRPVVVGKDGLKRTELVKATPFPNLKARFTISFETFINGGEERKLVVSGVRDEFPLRYPQTMQDSLPVSGSYLDNYGF